MQRVTVMRGIPGSGKSTYTMRLAPPMVVCSADHFHMKEGVYVFKPENAGLAHGLCLQNFVGAVTAGPGDRHVVVDNTNCAIWEMAPYCALALAYGFELKVVTILCDVDLAIKRNVHNVPAETIRRMADTLERHSVLMPRHWPSMVMTAEGVTMEVEPA